MAKTRVKMNKDGLRDLMAGPEARALIKKRADAVADACNADSSWGGYSSADASTEVRANAKVWSYGRHDDEARTNRLVTNLGAE